MTALFSLQNLKKHCITSSREKVVILQYVLYNFNSSVLSF
jgi:hypothetical protein